MARTLEKDVPRGSGRHQDLLLQMAAEIVAIRPPVIKAETRNCLDKYRGFRHVVRNVYTFNLQMSRLHELTKGLRNCFGLVKRDLDDFMGFIVQLSSSGSGKSDVLVKIRIHFISESIFARKFEFYMGWVDGAVGS